MQAILVLIALGWFLTTSWMTLVTCFAIMMIVVAVGCYVVHRLLSFDGIVPRRNRGSFDPQHVASMETILAEARAEAEALRAEIERLRATARTEKCHDRHSHAAALYRRVGLSDGAPDFVITAARRAFRSALHPDRHSPRVKIEAERRFVEAERVFDDINAIRARSA